MSESSSESVDREEMVPLVMIKKKLKEEVLIGSSYERTANLRKFKEEVRKNELLKWAWQQNEEEINVFINQYHQA